MNDSTAFERLGLTKSEAKLAFALYELNGAVGTTSYLLSLLYAPKVIEDMELVLHDIKHETWVLSGIRTLRVFLSKIRRKLAIDISSEYDKGYFYPEESMERLRRLLLEDVEPTPNRHDHSAVL